MLYLNFAGSRNTKFFFMISLFHGLYSYLTKKPEYGILVIGTSGVGKSCLFETIKSLFYDGYDRCELSQITKTMGLNVCKFTTQSCEITLWELGGQEGLRSIWKEYYQDCQALIYVIDSEGTFDQSENQRELESIFHEKNLEGVPIYLLFNEYGRKRSLQSEKLLEWSKSKIKSETTLKSFVLNVWNKQDVKRCIDEIISDVKTSSRIVNREDFV